MLCNTTNFITWVWSCMIQMAFPFSLITNIAFTRAKKIFYRLVKYRLNCICHILKFDINDFTSVLTPIIQNFVSNLSSWIENCLQWMLIKLTIYKVRCFFLFSDIVVWRNLRVLIVNFDKTIRIYLKSLTGLINLCLSVVKDSVWKEVFSCRGFLLG